MAIIVHVGNILFVRGSLDSKWDFPGGRLNNNETPKGALQREIFEELGLHVEVGGPIFVAPINAPHFKFPRLFIFYKSFLQNPGESMILQKEEIAEAKWFSKDEIDSVDTHAEWKEAIKVYLAN